jgi:hypothetical protein
LVGIGTTSPDEKLHIVGDLKIDSDLPRIYLSDSSHNPDYSIGNVNGSFFVFDDTNSAYRLYVNSAGNVGIGTNPFLATLHVTVLKTLSGYCSNGNVQVLPKEYITAVGMVQYNIGETQVHIQEIL